MSPLGNWPPEPTAPPPPPRVSPAFREQVYEACLEMIERFADNPNMFNETRHALCHEPDPTVVAEALRAALSVGRLRVNGIECALCGTKAYSTKLHEMGRCFCRKSWVEGGTGSTWQGGYVAKDISEPWPWLTTDGKVIRG